MDLLALQTPGTLQQDLIDRIDQSTRHSRGFKIGTTTRALEATMIVQQEVITEHETIVVDSDQNRIIDLEIMVRTIVRTHAMSETTTTTDAKRPSLWCHARKLPHLRLRHDLSRSHSIQDVQH